MPFRQRDRRPGRDRRSGSYVKASGATVASPSISVDGSRVLIKFTASDPSFSFLSVNGPVHQQSESYIKTTDISPALKGAANIDSRQKGSIFALTPSFVGAVPSPGTAIIKNSSSLRRGVVGGGGNGQGSVWSGGGGGGAAYGYDPSGVSFNFKADKSNKLIDYKFTGSATIGSASGTSSLQVTDALGANTPNLSAPGGGAGSSSHPIGSGGGGGVPGIGPGGASLSSAGTGGPLGNNGAGSVGGWPGCGAVPSGTCYAGGGGGAGATTGNENGGAALNIYPLFGEPGTYNIGGGGGAGGWGPGAPYPYGDGYTVCPGRARTTSSGPGPSGGSGGSNAGPGRNNAANNYGGGGGGGGNGGTGFPQTAGTGGSGVCFLRIA